MDGITQTLKFYDDFIQRVHLLYCDLSSNINVEKNHIETFDGKETSENGNLLIIPFFFRDKELLRFFCIYCSLDNDYSERKTRKNYKKICRNLDVIDPRYPLFLAYGACSGIPEKFSAHQLRQWTHALIGNYINSKDDSLFTFNMVNNNHVLNVNVDVVGSNWYFKKARYNIMKLTDIQNKEPIEGIVKNIQNATI